MASHYASDSRVLPDGTRLKNRLLAALDESQYARVLKHLRMLKVRVGEPLFQHGFPIVDVYFPNGGVYSVTNQMKDGSLVEVATVGTEGMIGVGVFLGDFVGAGTSLQQVPNGALPAMPARLFFDMVLSEPSFRDLIARYSRAYMLNVMQCTACNALHHLDQRCARWLLQTQDRVGADEFLLKHEFLAIMLGTQRPTVSHVLGSLQKAGLISTHYGHIRILNRPGLESMSCECYEAINAQFARLGIQS
jgi:CRP-like cAMP-binding protein